MKSAEKCCLLLTVTRLIFANYWNYMKDVQHEIRRYKKTDAGEDRKQSCCLGNLFSPIFHDLVFGAFPRCSGCLMSSAKGEMTGL